MPRDLPLGNGRLAVNFDRSYHLTDIYYPNIGKENQTAGRPCHFGAWRNGRFAWIGDEGFLPESMAYQEDTLVTQVSLVSADLGLRCRHLQDPIRVLHPWCDHSRPHRSAPVLRPEVAWPSFRPFPSPRDSSCQ